jgi:hypothetical protein
MMVVYEVHLAPDAGPVELLSRETLEETQAQVMTLDEARKVGFGGLPAPPDGVEVRLIAVAKRDAGWVQKRLEANDGVAGFKVHEVG